MVACSGCRYCRSHTQGGRRNAPCPSVRRGRRMEGRWWWVPGRQDGDSGDEMPSGARASCYRWRLEGCVPRSLRQTGMWWQRVYLNSSTCIASLGENDLWCSACLWCGTLVWGALERGGRGVCAATPEQHVVESALRIPGVDQPERDRKEFLDFGKGSASLRGWLAKN